MLHAIGADLSRATLIMVTRTFQPAWYTVLHQLLPEENHTKKKKKKILGFWFFLTSFRIMARFSLSALGRFRAIIRMILYTTLTPRTRRSDVRLIITCLKSGQQGKWRPLYLKYVFYSPPTLLSLEEWKEKTSFWLPVNWNGVLATIHVYSPLLVRRILSKQSNDTDGVIEAL